MGAAFYTESFVLEQVTGDHDFSADTIKAALFDGDAALDQETTAYSATSEVANGNGYTTGGATLTLSTGYPKIESSRGAVRYDTLSWTLTADTDIRYILIYNSSQSNKSIMVIDLGEERTYTGAFQMLFPTTMAPVIHTASAFPS